MLSNMYKSSVTHVLVSVLLVCLAITLAACSSDVSGNGGNTAHGGSTPGSTQRSGTTTVATVVTGKSNNGPVVILSPTPVPGGGVHSQQVALFDRTLIINDVSQSAGTNANSITITLSVEIKNTSSKSIMNQSAYFLMTSSEGDSFGVTSSPTGSFYGTIGASSSHSGTLVFQIPSAAVNGLHLMYHPEVPKDTAFLPITLG